jgi:hypothetical protein
MDDTAIRDVVDLLFVLTDLKDWPGSRPHHLAAPASATRP